jgi:FHS family L-fucose permease-like MFS transporter
MALPAGYYMRRIGYRKGIILGLCLFAAGCLIIAATTSFESFWIFLFCLFIIGCGLATLETAANPYTTILGPSESAERRINFSQSFNGLAWVIGPLIGLYIYNGQNTPGGEKLSSLFLPYLIIAIVVLIVVVIFLKTPMPEIKEEATEKLAYNQVNSTRSLFSKRHFVLGIVAQFSYVAAQTGVFSYLINFVTDANQYPRFDKSYGPLFLSVGFALFMIGRMSGSYFMKFFKPSGMLAVYSIACCILLPVVSSKLGWTSLICLYGVFFFMSIMFPTIFALSIKNLGPETKKASAYIVMSIVGGAVFPPVMGLIADKYTMSAGFLATVPFFLIITFYALFGSRLKPEKSFQ